MVQTIRSEVEDQESSVLRYKIVSYPADYTLKGLYDKWKNGDIRIPPFQRHWVWTHGQASRLIDSFLLGLPVPSIFLYKDLEERLLVVDGQQRLRSICAFFDGKLPDGTNFPLRGVSSQWEGKYYSDFGDSGRRYLDDSDRRKLDDCVLRAIIVEQLDPKDDTSLYHIFERLNTGGTELKPQEVRNCVYHGPFNDFVIKLNKYEQWRTIFGTSRPDNRMRDVELIIRFLALARGMDKYTKPMKNFVSAFMKDHQTSSDNGGFESLFQGTVDSVVGSLGHRPFHLVRGLNVAAYDSVMVAFAVTKAVPSDIRARYEKLKRNDAYLRAISAGTTDEETVRTRIKLAREILFA